MDAEIHNYHEKLDKNDQAICELLYSLISSGLKKSEHKIWHAHPVWFIDGNPIVGYSKQKKGIRLMFWSGADFDEDFLVIRGGKFKDASVFFNHVTEINAKALKRALKKSILIQWDYKNIVKRKGKLIKF